MSQADLTGIGLVEQSSKLVSLGVPKVSIGKQDALRVLQFSFGLNSDCRVKQLGSRGLLQHIFVSCVSGRTTMVAGDLTGMSLVGQGYKLVCLGSLGGFHRRQDPLASPQGSSGCKREPIARQWHSSYNSLLQVVPSRPHHTHLKDFKE